MREFFEDLEHALSFFVGLEAEKELSLVGVGVRVEACRRFYIGVLGCKLADLVVVGFHEKGRGSISGLGKSLDESSVVDGQKIFIDDPIEPKRGYNANGS